MAYTDWTFINAGACAHTAQPYSISFPAPTVDSGAYARFVSVQPDTYSYYAGFVPAGLQYTGVPSTKAIRVQTYYALSNISVWPALIAKATPVPVGAGVSGYRLKRVNDQLIFETPGFFSQTLTSGLGTGWISLRMTVYPIATNIDRVICERESSPGSGTWSSAFSMSSGDITINGNLTPARYVAWGGSTKNGVIASSNGSVGDGYFLDKMQVALANVPAPLP